MHAYAVGPLLYLGYTLALCFPQWSLKSEKQYLESVQHLPYDGKEEI